MRGLDSSPVGEPADRLGSVVHASGPGTRFTNLVRLDQVDSTNRFARDAALEGAPEGLVVVAEEQLAGRGRRGRVWAAPHGSSLLCSMLFRPGFGPEAFHLLPTIVGLAALDALHAFIGAGAGLKWPNDVVVGDAKLAGILAESVGTTAASAAPAHLEPVAPAVVVGIGINVAWPAGWPPAGVLGALALQATTVERVAGRPVEREQLLTSMLAQVGRRYLELRSASGRAGTSSEYRDRCTTIGRRVRLELASSKLDSSAVEGRAVDVDQDGRLVLELDGGQQRSYSAGDVVHLR